MKSIKALSLIISLFTFHWVSAQSKEVNELTQSYFSIKNALVADDADAAKINAEIFGKQLEAISKITLNASQEKAWKEQSNKLASTSNTIANTSDINKQREQLNELSNALFAVLKAFKANENAVYYQYCPMKKAYWLSAEKEIKNPYYGKKMLTCGSVKETLK